MQMDIIQQKLRSGSQRIEEHKRQVARVAANTVNRVSMVNT
jgi:hypothetical protein